MLNVEIYDIVMHMTRLLLHKVIDKFEILVSDDVEFQWRVQKIWTEGSAKYVFSMIDVNICRGLVYNLYMHVLHVHVCNNLRQVLVTNA